MNSAPVELNSYTHRSLGINSAVDSGRKCILFFLRSALACWSQLGDWGAFASDAALKQSSEVWHWSDTEPEQMKMLIGGSSDCSNGRWSSRSPLNRRGCPKRLSKHKCHLRSDHEVGKDKHTGFMSNLSLAEKSVAERLSAFFQVGVKMNFLKTSEHVSSSLNCWWIS